MAIQRSLDGNSGHPALAYLDPLYSYALTLTRDQTKAEDLVQETYLRAVRAFGDLSPNSNLKGWLFVILRNAWLNQLRHERSGPRFVELETEGTGNRGSTDARMSDPYVLYLRKVEREEIVEAIAQLPVLHREVVILRDIEGFSYQEIATMIGCPAGTVMSRLGRAREKLRRILSGSRSSKPACAV